LLYIYSSRGYDETHNTYYQVVGYRGKTMILVREIERRDTPATPDDQQLGTSLPIPDSFSHGDEISLPFSRKGVSLRPYLENKKHDISCRPWNNEPNHYLVNYR